MRQVYYGVDPVRQVYYGVTRPEFGGVEVAVKVQRPGVLEAVALDLMLIRSIAVAIKDQVRKGENMFGCYGC